MTVCPSCGFRNEGPESFCRNPACDAFLGWGQERVSAEQRSTVKADASGGGEGRSTEDAPIDEDTQPFDTAAAAASSEPATSADPFATGPFTPDRARPSEWYELDIPRVDTPRVDTPRQDAPRQDAPAGEGMGQVPERQVLSAAETAWGTRDFVHRPEAPGPREAPPRETPPRGAPPREGPPREGPPRDAPRQAPPRGVRPRQAPPPGAPTGGTQPRDPWAPTAAPPGSGSAPFPGEAPPPGTAWPPAERQARRAGRAGRADRAGRAESAWPRPELGGGASAQTGPARLSSFPSEEQLLKRPPLWERLLRRTPIRVPGEGTLRRSRSTRERERRRALLRFGVLVLVIVLVGGGLWLAAGRGPARVATGGDNSGTRSTASPALTKVRPGRVVASTQSGSRLATNVVDGKTDTFWSRSAPSNDDQPFLRFFFDRSVKLARISIAAGASGDEFERRPRPRKVELRFSDGTSMRTTLADRTGFQTVDFAPRKVDVMRLVILSTYPSAGPQRTSISEIRFFAAKG